MNICVYGASSKSIDEKYIKAGEALGEQMAERGHTLVFGGGGHGMMGAVARGVKKGGGKVIGVAPSFFNVDGVRFDGCDEFIYTETMRERKQIMEDRSDAFIAAPGGVGTFEELFGIITLKQLGRHSKPIAVFNINGYFDSLIEQLKNAVRKQFMNPESFELCFFTDNADKLINYLEYAVSEPEQAKIYKQL